MKQVVSTPHFKKNPCQEILVNSLITVTHAIHNNSAAASRIVLLEWCLLTYKEIFQ